MTGGTSQPSALAEIREADASPEIAAIYADIRAASAIPQVNLIYRHLATEPAVLAWAWTALAPVFRSGEVAAAAAELSAAVPGDGGAPLWAACEPEAAAGIEAVLAFYNRANPQNLIALTALVMAARRSTGFSSVCALFAEPDRPAAAAPAADPLLPPLPRRDALDAASRALVDDLATRQGSGIGVTPSLYLHLAHWPSAIRAASARMSPLVGTAAFEAHVATVLTQAASRADVVARSLDLGPQRPPKEVLRPTLTTVESFVGATIPQMIVVGRILAGAPAAD